MKEFSDVPESEFYDALVAHYDIGVRVLENVLRTDDDAIIPGLASHEFLASLSPTEAFIEEANQEAEFMYYTFEEKIIDDLNRAKAKLHYLRESFELTDFTIDPDLQTIAEIIGKNESPLKTLLQNGLSDKFLKLITALDEEDPTFGFREALIQLWCDENGHTKQRLRLTYEEYKVELDKRINSTPLSAESAVELIGMLSNPRTFNLLVKMGVIPEDHPYGEIEVSPYDADLEWYMTINHRPYETSTSAGMACKTTIKEIFELEDKQLLYRKARVISKLDTESFTYIDDVEISGTPRPATAEQLSFAASCLIASAQVLTELTNMDQAGLWQALNNSED